jgi:hypothetical protein
MSKVLDKFKKKDKAVKQGGAPAGEKEADAEDVEPRRHLPPVYLTCADVHPPPVARQRQPSHLNALMVVFRICPRI